MAPRNLPTSSNHPNQFRSQARDDFSRSVANNIYENRRSEEEIHLAFLSFPLSFFRNGFFYNLIHLKPHLVSSYKFIPARNSSPRSLRSLTRMRNLKYEVTSLSFGQKTLDPFLPSPSSSLQKIKKKNSFPSALLFSTLRHGLRAMFPAASFTDRNKTIVVEIFDLT
ncbi:hypothetical protein ALC53_09319 [Atta colombica]|uniref:Uncharacterized protein n=1 Tax=Atta colombica TaxID=520822 RepID=A0A195B7K3_9HYME|nr:hypothetical protein ALC53_09319 [Atta colombica]